MAMRLINRGEEVARRGKRGRRDSTSMSREIRGKCTTSQCWPTQPSVLVHVRRHAKGRGDGFSPVAYAAIVSISVRDSPEHLSGKWRCRCRVHASGRYGVALSWLTAHTYVATCVACVSLIPPGWATIAVFGTPCVTMA
jgi:hypothetical protein